MLRIELSLLLLLLAPLAACAPDGSPRHAPEHGHHSFEGAERWAQRFDDPARDAWQKPDAVLARLALVDGMRVADIGSGTGYFAVRLARALPAGRVYGIDVEPDMVRYLNERAAKEGLANLESRLGQPDDPQLPEAVDLVLVVDTYHHIADRVAYFERLAGQLAPGARIAIVDFKPGELPVGPPEEMKVPAERIVGEMRAAGYRLEVDDRTLLPYQDLLIFAHSR
jgi:SAM-dependent methyltransferase